MLRRLDNRSVIASPPPVLDGTPSARNQAPAANDAFARVASKAVPQRAKLAPDTERIVTTAQRLIRIPSQGGIDDPRPICDAVQEALRDAGLPGELLLHEGQAVGVVAMIPGAHPGPTYVLNAVVDTAPVGEENQWSAKPFSAELRGHQLIGRGAGDSKTAAAIFIEVGRRLAERSAAMHGNAVLFFDAAEHTGEFQGIRAFIETHCKVRPSGMLIGYPGNESLQIGSRGFMRRQWQLEVETPGSPAAIGAALAAPNAIAMPEGRSLLFPLDAKLTTTAVETCADTYTSTPGTVFDVAIAGKAAHSGSSAKAGVNALSKAGAFLDELVRRGTALFGSSFAPLVLGLDGGREFSQVPDCVHVRVLVPETSTTAERALHVVRSAMQTVDEVAPTPQPSVVAERRTSSGAEPLARYVTLNIDVRTTTSFDIEDAARHLEALASLAEARGLASRHVDREAWPAFRLAEHSPLQTAMMTAIRDAGLMKVQPRISGPSNAGNVAAAFGIPTTAGFGVSCKHAHGTNESINVASIPTALRVYSDALHKLLGIQTAV